MVCCMYYTDVFVGADNIEKLRKALEAVLEESGLKTDDLDQLNALASGLGFLAGLPACLCKTKKSVEEGLQKIYEELKTSLISCDNLQLNCDLCKSNLYPCKCCVIQSIKEVKGCECLKGKDSCHCAASDVSCNKVLAGLEACLHLQCLQSDMEDICKCSDPEKCCKTGQCNGVSKVSCGFCQNLQTKTPVATTGLGLSPPNPIRLAERLETFFGQGPKTCTCTCGSGSLFNSSCCCLACGTGKCSQACTSQCPCPQASGPCPRKTFCEAIQNVKVLVGSRDMTCCSKGADCHCGLDSGSNACSGSGCCVVTSKRNSYHSLKCLIRRLVKFFKDFESSSNQNCSKLCCEIFCVLKISYFLKKLFNDSKSWAGKECSKCKGGGSTCPQGTKQGSCCGGNPSQCVSSSNSDPTCCQGCPECNAIKLGKALQELQYSGPCGQDLWRTLDSFLHYCCNVLEPFINRVQSTVQKARKSCPCQSKKPPQFPCQCSTSSPCTACQEILKDFQLKVTLTQEYVSSYDSSKASWPDCSKSGSKCCGSSPSCNKCQPDCSSNPSSCPKNCCEKCPKRLCAKIFLGMLPCLYYGLKFLKEKCEVDWKDLYISNKDHSLGRFLVGMGFDLAKLQGKKTGGEIFGPLNTLFNGSKFKDLYEKSKNYFTSRFTSRSHVISSHSHVPSSDSKTPSTVREILLWLSGLPFTSGFEALLKHCESLCEPVNSLKFNDFESSLYSSCFLSPFVLATIQWPEGPFIYDSLINSENFYYPSDPFDLFNMLLENVRKIFPVLKFLCLQCENGAAQGGWTSCRFGQKCAQALKSSSPSGSFTSP
ncbi:variant erythrocyte surface antigen-1, alpha subunit, partial [Babesia divergens]